MRYVATALFWLIATCFPVMAQGTLNIALTQQFSFLGCVGGGGNSPCGQPLVGGLLYFYQAGTNIVQNSFQETGLTTVNPWPLVLDANGRVPMFYLPTGSVHVRLTDATGVVQFDYPNMLVIGAGATGPAGGTNEQIMTTGDVKWRPSAEVLSGWVRMNGGTIGNAVSLATERANADVEALYTYLWTTFSSPSSNAKCPISGGLGASALADFNAGKQMTILDMRARVAVGLDSMGNTAPASRIAASNVTSGGGDGIDTAAATGGQSNHTLTIAEMPTHSHGGSIAVHDFFYVQNEGGEIAGGSTTFVQYVMNLPPSGTLQPRQHQVFVELSSFGSIQDEGGGAAHNNMEPFMLGTFYMKL